MIDALTPLSNNILIVVCTLVFFLIRSSRINLICLNLPRRFGDKIIPKVIDDKAIASNNSALFEIDLLLGWLTR